MTGRSLHTEEEILVMATACADALVRYGDEVGLEGPADIIAGEIRLAAKSDPSVLVCAQKVAGLALKVSDLSTQYCLFTRSPCKQTVLGTVCLHQN